MGTYVPIIHLSYYVLDLIDSKVFMLTRSKYKADSPSNTVKKIQQILSALGIEVQCRMNTNSGPYFSCRLTISNETFEFFNVGTNGKGMSEEYALASAYAEFMERLQNKALFRDNLQYATPRFLKGNNYPFELPHLEFQYFPDEEERLLNLNELNNEIIPSFFPLCKAKLDNNKALYPCIFAPFEELTRKKNQMIPVEYYRAVCGTTGMSAGNSREEAIVQGINEIFERYVLMKLFIEKPDLPQIELSIFRGFEIHEKIHELEKKYSIIIKDCSLGIGLPVIGLLLINRENGTYAFRLGADYNIITALERCYTESFQGSDAERYIFSRFDAEAPQDQSQYKMAVKNGRGRFPHCVLYPSSLKPRFPHHDFHTYEEELQYCITFIGSLGMTLYVKDNSFLGFPAFSVYIPGLSDIDPQLFNLKEMIENKRIEHGRTNALLNVVESVSRHPREILSNLAMDNTVLQKWNASKSARINSGIIGMYVYAAKKDYYHAAKMIDKISNSNNSPLDLRCARDVLISLSNGNNLSPVRAIYGDIMVNTCLEQFNNVVAFLDSQPFPRCFQCHRCLIKHTCYFKKVLEFEIKLQSIQKKHCVYYHPIC